MTLGSGSNGYERDLDLGNIAVAGGVGLILDYIIYGKVSGICAGDAVGVEMCIRDRF